MRLRIRPCSAFILTAAWLFPLVLSETSNRAAAQTTPAGELHIDGAVATPLTLTVADLKKMPRKSLTVDNPHTGKKETYVGVPVEELLRKAGVPQGENLRGKSLANYVVAEAEDGYRVVFSLAELDSGITDSDLIVADTMDGSPLGEKVGPLRIVAPHEKRPARWVRMLKSLTVVNAPAETPAKS